MTDEHEPTALEKILGGDSVNSNDGSTDVPDPNSGPVSPDPVDSYSGAGEDETVVEAEDVKSTDETVLKSSDDVVPPEDTLDNTTPRVDSEPHADEAPLVTNTDIEVASMGQAYQGDGTNPLDYQGPAKKVEVDFTIAAHNDQARQRDPNGIYLDDVERSRYEVIRAKAEGREPDLENAPAYCGDVVKQVAAYANTVPGDYVIEVSSTQEVEVGTPVDEQTDTQEASESESDEVKV